MTMTRNDYLTKSYSTKRSFNWENEIFRLNVLRTMVIVEFFTAMHSFVNINKKRFRPTVIFEFEFSCMLLA